MTTSPARTIRKFNPGVFQSDREVVDQFVVRERELRVVLEQLRENIGAPSCQHTLVVAPRGRGKTMLLARVAAEIRTNPGLHRALVPVRFMEESVEVFDIGDFWLEALMYFAKECTEDYPVLGGEIEATHATLARRTLGEDVARQARAALLDAADRLGKQLVFMVENLQSLCEEVDEDFGWQLRQSLQSDPEIILLGTATSRFEALDDVGAPFFELFRVVQLEPLNTAECQRLWHVITGEQCDARRMRPLEIFTGGNPRLLVIVAEFSRHRTMAELLEELVGLVDDHTDYFRSNLNSLPKTERRVFAALADLWRPAATREVATRARLGVRKTSALLGRLAGRGAVKVAGNGRSRLYSVGEPLHCIYYKLRRWRGEADAVHGLIRFMVAFYGPDETQKILGSVLNGRTHQAVLLGAQEDLDPDCAGIPASGAALTKTAAAQMTIGRDEPGVAACNEAFRRYSASDRLDLRCEVTMALELKAMILNRLGRGREALETCELLVRGYGNIAGQGAIPVAWRAMGSQVHAMVLLGDEPTAARRFGKMCKDLDVADNGMLGKFVWDTIDLMAIGATPGVIADAIEASAEDCEELVPLRAALRRLAGRPERVPEECEKVVRDIVRAIKEKRREWPVAGQSG